jgi:hypothetical protein
MSNDRDDEMTLDQHGIEDRFEYRATIETSLAASALARGRRRLGTAVLVIGWFAIVALGAFGTILGIDKAVTLVGALTIAIVPVCFFQIDPVVRWQLNRYYASMFGSNVVAEIRPSGITFLQGGMTAELSWTSFTAIKANDQAVVFLKGRAPLAAMPVSAFGSPAGRDAFVSLVRTRIPAPA